MAAETNVSLDATCTVDNILWISFLCLLSNKAARDALASQVGHPDDFLNKILVAMKDIYDLMRAGQYNNAKIIFHTKCNDTDIATGTRTRNTVNMAGGEYQGVGFTPLTSRLFASSECTSEQCPRGEYTAGVLDEDHLHIIDDEGQDENILHTVITFWEVDLRARDVMGCLMRNQAILSIV